MNKSRTIIVSVAVFLVCGGLIIGWSVYQRGGIGDANAAVRVFTDENFEKEVVEASTRHPILVDFYAPWCFPCRMLEPIIEEVARELKGQAVIGKLDTERNLLPRRLGVTQIPSVWIVKDGEIRESFLGVVSKEKIIQALKKSGS